MKDQYVGDINDYRKYGLLRAICRATDLKLGVWWMRTPPDDRRDGRRIGYLRRPQRWQRFDKELFDALTTIVRKDDRGLHAVEQAGVLRGTRFLSDVVPRDPAARERHLSLALDLARNCDLLFIDPDNGMEVPSCPKTRVWSDKHLYWTELKQLYAAGSSIVLYQHSRRVARHIVQAAIAAQISATLDTAYPIVLRAPGVAYFVIPQPARRRRLEQALEQVVTSWRPQIAFFPLEPHHPGTN